MNKSGLTTTIETLASRRGGKCVIHCQGVIDAASAFILEKAMVEVLKEKIYKIVVDLTKVEFISSAGWGIFAGYLKEIKQHDGEIILAGMRPNIEEVFRLLELDSLIRFSGTVDEAIALIEQPPQEPSTSVVDDTIEELAIDNNKSHSEKEKAVLAEQLKENEASEEAVLTFDKLFDLFNEEKTEAVSQEEVSQVDNSREIRTELDQLDLERQRLAQERQELAEEKRRLQQERQKLREEKERLDGIIHYLDSINWFAPGKRSRLFWDIINVVREHPSYGPALILKVLKERGQLYGKSVSPSTIYRRLKSIGLNTRVQREEFIKTQKSKSFNILS